MSRASRLWVVALSLLIGAAPVGATESMDCSMELLVELRASGPPGNIRGTLTYKGKTWKVRCTGDE